MRQAKKKKGRDRVAATIFLCFCLITLTSIFTIQSSINKVNESAAKVPISQQTPTKPDLEESPASKDIDDSDARDNRQVEEATPIEETSLSVPIVDSHDVNDTSAFLPPLNLETASVTKKYAMDTLLYNKTLDQYMTHPGIDIEAPAKSGVNAIGDGTITDVYMDDAYGMTVELRLNDEFIARYSNLDEKVSVEKGDVVTRGQKLGSIGQTAMYESMEKSHLHFALYQGNTICNPTDYIDF